MNLKEELIIHDELNPKLWKDNKLIPEVRQKLLQIVAYFEDYIDCPISILDAQICGSQASFNYSDTSDLDLHVMVNFDNVDASEEVLQSLYNAKKSSFNNNTDITIKGIQVELYIQDIHSMANSNGIYSVCDDAWIKEPKPITNVKKHDTTEELQVWSTKINEVIATNNYDKIQEVIDSLYLMRLNSLASEGEFGKGNQVFKDIRSQGYLDKLKEALNNSLSRKLSLESYSGAFINRYE